MEDREMLLQQLKDAEARVEISRDNVTRQRRIVTELRALGGELSTAQALLRSLEGMLEAREAQRDQLKKLIELA